MTAISLSDVKKLATLSALDMSDEELARLTPEIERIRRYVEKLSEVNTDGVEPTYQVNHLHTVVREDKIIDYGIDQKALLKNAPDTLESQIKVHRIVE